MLKHDKTEDIEEYKEVFKKVNFIVEKMLEEENVKKQKGYIHIFENRKKKILKDRYGIEWKTTQEMNPDILID